MNERQKFIVEECISAQQAQDKLNQYAANYDFLGMTTGKLGGGFGEKNFILLTFRLREQQPLRKSEFATKR